MTFSHHWLGILGAVAVVVGTIGLTVSNTGATAKPTPQSEGKTSLPPASASAVESSADSDLMRTIRLSISEAFTPKIDTESTDAPLTQPAQTTSVSIAKITTANDKTPPAGAIPEAEATVKATGQKTAAPEPAADQIKTTTIRKGDNMTVIFRRLGLPRNDLQRILADRFVSKTLRNIHPGRTMEARIAPDGSLSALRYEPEDAKSLRIVFSDDVLQVEEIVDHPESRIAFAEGAIDNNLFEAAAKMGLSDKQILSLADIFAWDVDFSRDIRPGDQFAVLYEALYRNDKRIDTGRILAAEFINHGQRHRTVHFEHKNHSGYYDPEGRPMRKAFLRSPVNFTRISSGFSLKRWHPKLHRFRAHKGVDYTAPTGTPVQAAGDGRVTFAGNKGGYGRVVIIQHGQRYSTLYAHLHRIKRGVKTGARVTQGQTIGTVGSSGLATGPHLHYEFRVDGAHRDPLRVKLPGAPALPKNLMAQFRSQTSKYLGQLAQRTSIHLATRD